MPLKAKELGLAVSSDFLRVMKGDMSKEEKAGIYNQSAK